MRAVALSTLSLMLFAGAASPQGPRRPEGAAPMQHTAWVKDGQIIREYTVTFYKTVDQEVEKIGPDGKIVKAKVAKTVPVQEKKLQTLDLKKAAVMRADGKTVSAEEAAKLLEKPTEVLFGIGGDGPVDPFYLQFFKPETLIVLPPKFELPQDKNPGA